MSSREGDTLHVDLSGEGLKSVDIDLIDIRGASIRIEYDKQRRGWAVKQAIGWKDDATVWGETICLPLESMNYHGCHHCGMYLPQGGKCEQCGY